MAEEGVEKPHSPIKMSLPTPDMGPAGLTPVSISQEEGFHLATTAVHTIDIKAQMHQGPLPPVEYFEQLEKIVPGSANRIILMAENAANHASGEQKRTNGFIFVERMTARITAFIFAISALFLAGYLAINNHDTVAGIVAGTTIVGVVVALVTGKGVSSGFDGRPEGSDQEQ
ncbi:DUF2335 domain-containing protein [Acetobacteraceae bacterium H6797]|nr:DUF2335 domain-containing protein [Acetobacteraceae bacterium H6797]